MNPKKLKKYFFESVISGLEHRKRTKEEEKLLDDALKFEEKFCKDFSDEKRKEYCELSFKQMLYDGCETCGEIKFAIDFVVDLFLSIR